MKVFITEPAKVSLREICKYYRSKGFGAYAKRLRIAVISSAKNLAANPFKGQEEELLRPLHQGHRYLIIEEHYKLIYLPEAENIYVTDIFDTRQHPDKMLKRHQ
ncbi:type II toxin-antitoxin system RelE/ParE family toxin [Nafulsella turpanensis]|uniref:type II toxin-antitoxin system RelE/ParE family toxin n=1 Tax=Nafulsella turpanensis TaxID=1265690 RepID=UPI00037AA97C|nr:type II toxin-antitoxin system RelE/ParE family toxin [Nafulsella turpanensis]